MKSAPRLLCCGRRDDSSDSEHGGRRSRQTRTAPAPTAAPASSSRDRRQLQPVTQSLQSVDQIVVTTATGTNSLHARQSVDARRAQCLRDDSVDSSNTRSAGGASCVASPPTSLCLHTAGHHHQQQQQLHRRAPACVALLTRRLAPETCV